MSAAKLGNNAAHCFARLGALLGFLLLASMLPAYAQSSASSFCWEVQPKGQRLETAHRLDEEQGKISELKDKQHFLVVETDLPRSIVSFPNPQRDQLIRRQVELELLKYHSLTVATDPGNADFFVQVMVYPGEPTTSVSATLFVFTRGTQQADGCYSRRIVWQRDQFQDQTSGLALDPTMVTLDVTHRFIRDLKRARGEK
jgi:hypothetical protein